MEITVVGSSYVGLISGACLVGRGSDVLCLDVDPKEIELFNNGGVPFYEPGLYGAIWHDVEVGRLHFTTDSRYFRQTAVKMLLGDHSKAKEKTGWAPNPLFRS